MTAAPWSRRVSASDVARAPGGALAVRLEASQAERKGLAPTIGALEVLALDADAVLAPWRDGLEVRVAWRARLVRECGVTLEPFEVSLDGRFEVRAVPPGADAEPDAAEIDIDLDADDPPDVLEAGTIDLAAYVVEHLILDLDPHPRRPGAVFEPPPPDPEASPFAALKGLRPPVRDA